MTSAPHAAGAMYGTSRGSSAARYWNPLTDEIAPVRK